LVTGAGKKFKILNVESGKCFQELKDSEFFVESVAFRPDGQHVAQGGLSKRVLIWDIEKSVCLCSLEGHKKEVITVTFSPNGKFLASGSSDCFSHRKEKLCPGLHLKFKRPSR
jgi:WD40 repeat protein